MRSTFRKDLPLYELPEKKKRPVKRNLLNENAPQRVREDVMFQSLPLAKKRKVADDNKDCEVVGVHRPAAPRYEWSDYRYYPVACKLLDTVRTTISTTRR